MQFHSSLCMATRADSVVQVFCKLRRPKRRRHSTRNLFAPLRALGVTTETGVFQTHMSVELVNDGPVTILLDSDKLF